MQPFALVAFTVYVPGANDVATCVVCPLLHKYVYGAVPPVITAFAAPVLPEHELWPIILTVSVHCAFALIAENSKKKIGINFNVVLSEDSKCLFICCFWAIFIFNLKSEWMSENFG